MKKLLFISLLFSFTISNAQQVQFEYDSAGNQILRTWCPSCSSRTTNESIKEISDLEESDLQKFFPEDIISYYPNPVKEELYLKWDLINENEVSSIEMFNLNGQLIYSYKNKPFQNAHTISFYDYPTGVYFVNLNYSDGEKKSIKIVKK